MAVLKFYPKSYIGYVRCNSVDDAIDKAKSISDPGMTTPTDITNRVGITNSSNKVYLYRMSYFFEKSSGGNIPLLKCRNHVLNMSFRARTSGVSYFPNLYYGPKANAVTTNFAYTNRYIEDCENWRGGEHDINPIYFSQSIPDSCAWVFGGFDKTTYCALYDPYLQVETETLTLEYNANGGIGAPNLQSVDISENGYIATISTVKPTKDGYKFAGWARTPNASGATYQPGQTFEMTTNMTLYAVWQKLSYTVTFDPNGGTVSTTTKTVTYGETYGELPIPVRSGYKFDGWFTQLSGGTLITESSIVDLTGDTTLYAHWTVQSIVHVVDKNNQMQDGIVYVSDGNNTLHIGIVYVCGSDGNLHVNG